jgi:hypothetical protein
LTITAPALLGWLHLADHGDGTATLAGAPTNADVGDHAVVLRVTDSGGLTGTQSFTITVHNANDAPEFTSAPVTTATQDTTYSYAVAADDLDLIHGDVLTITAPTLPGWLKLTDDGNGNGAAILAGTPTNDDVGEHPVTLQVADSGGLTGTQSFTITVHNANDAPAFTSMPIRTTVQDKVYSYAVTAEDVDLPHGDVLTITALALPGWLTLTDYGIGAALLTGTPSSDDIGEHEVLLQATDSGGLTDTQSFTITVRSANAPPQAAGDEATTTEGTSVTIYVLENDTDPDGDALTVITVSQPLYGSASTDGTTVVYTPTLGFVGRDDFTYTISDGYGGEDTATITVLVKPQDAFYIFLPIVSRMK